MTRVDDLAAAPQPLVPLPNDARAAISNRYTLTIRTARKSLKTLIGGTV